MTKILFERTKHAYLPEISAYVRYLAAHYPGIEAVDSHSLEHPNPADFEIIWKFMGIDTCAAGKFIVHEYNSLSSGIFPKFKNTIKKTINARPHHRVFLNEDVQKGFGFCDDVPARFREMGVDDQFFNTQCSPEYDFIYAGSFNRGPETGKLLDYFANTLKDATLLAVGEAGQDIRGHYRNAKNIVFTGRVPYTDIPALMAKARHGLNIMPDRYPYNLQTATKVLEYCALGLPLVSSRYEWIEKFVQQRGAKIFWLEKDFSNLSRETLRAFSFNTPSVADLRWDNMIEKSGVFDFLT